MLTLQPQEINDIVNALIFKASALRGAASRCARTTRSTTSEVPCCDKQTTRRSKSNQHRRRFPSFSAR